MIFAGSANHHVWAIRPMAMKMFTGMRSLKVAMMVESYCSSAIAFADSVLLFEKYVG
jgi:hypothetical protein